MNKWKLGVYVHPDAVAASPDYAKRLVEEAGVDHFVLRSGYDLSIPESLEAAMGVVHNVKAQSCCLVGTWWYPEKEKPRELPYRTNEGEFLMYLPGSEMDTGIIAKLNKLCGQYKPDAICLTHARYRHPAHIEGIYNDGENDKDYLAKMDAAGVSRGKVLEMRAAVERAMGQMDKVALLKAAEGGLISFLGELAQNDVPKRFFSFRRDMVIASYCAFEKAVRPHGVAFGTNAYSPIAVDVCGHDYEAFAGMCDFVQPLLPYMEFHRLMPIAAWAKYLRKFAHLDDASAIEITLRLFRLGGAVCPNTIAELDTCAEGGGATVKSILSAEFKMCSQLLPKPYPMLPVLRGRDWGRSVIDELTREAKDMFGAVVLMGCEYLADGSPSLSGWF